MLRLCLVESDENQRIASDERLVTVLFISSLLFNDISIIFEVMKNVTYFQTCLAQSPESANIVVGLLSAVIERQILVCSSAQHGFNLLPAEQILRLKF